MNRVLLLLIGVAVVLIAAAAIGRKVGHMPAECECPCHKAREQEE